MTKTFMEEKPVPGMRYSEFIDLVSSCEGYVVVCY